MRWDRQTGTFRVYETGGGGGGDNRAIEEQKAEEERRKRLREQVGFLFGEGPEMEDYITGYKTVEDEQQQDDDEYGTRFRRVSRQEPIYGKRSTGVTAARAQFGGEESELGQALRGQYGDELKREYEQAERATRFGAARTGNIGGSAYADALAQLEERNRRGGVLTEEAVQRAITALRGSREEAKNRAFGLISAGAGDQAVAAARSGIQGSIEGARSREREQLFTDLFSDIALAKRGADTNARNDAALAYFARLRGAGGLGATDKARGPEVINY